MRSRVWEHFEQIKDDKGNAVRAKCLYCAKIFACVPKRHGTSSLRNHMLSCMKNPYNKDSKQVLLTFKPDNASSDSVGVVATWKFDQEAIRKALCNLLIQDELPFKFVEGEGFKNFMIIVCPRFKVPSR